ncbi:MAG: glycoside hydrolase [Ruminococcus sp.]|nr:glycoside hydrolase [Ruminococcus sp.]
MKINKLAALAAAAAVTLTGCGNKIKENETIPDPKETDAVTTTVTSVASEAETAPEPLITSSEDAKITAQDLPFTEFETTVEAEEGAISGKAEVKKEREAFSGEGYVSGIDKEGGVELSFEAPESQYYNISVAVASAKKNSCSLNVNASHIGDFSVADDDKFALVTFSNIYLEKGTVKLALTVSDGVIDFDYASAAASTEVRDLSLQPLSGKLIDPEADYNAQALYSYICQSFGKQVLTGQHDTVGTLTETRKIYELTGRNAAVRFGDLMPFTQDMIMGENEIEYALRWAGEGGLTAYMWHWIDPIGGKSYYSDETDFDLSKAVTKEDIATLTIEELEELHKDKKISDECLAIVKDIDKISAKLAELRDNGVAVIWRPLHEASNGYFWWGHDKASYKWLWDLLYKRQTQYHDLHNLIWVWSAQNAEWYVGDKKCDIISADIYDKGNLTGHPERLIALRNISAKKPIMMSECGTTPSIQSMADRHALWSCVGQWGGSYLLTEDASINPDYNKEADLIAFYSNDITVTREKLPDLKAVAADLEEAAKKAEAEKKDESSKSDDTSKTESKTDDSKKDDSSKTESKSDDSKKADSSKTESKSDSSKKDDASKTDSKKS